MSNHELKKGYKQTDVGILPEDWEVKRFCEISKLSKGKGLLKEDIKRSGSIPAIPYTALYTDYTEVLDYNLIKWFIDDESQSVIVSEPCLLLASSSNMEANTGKASALTRDTPVAIGREIIIFKTSSDCKFISYLLSTPTYRKKTLTLARGTTIKHVYPATFQGYQIALPPLPEQQAIAEVLSDADALITSLDALLTKKRNIKQGTMQLLLTGKKRLVAETKKGYKQTEIGIIPKDWKVMTYGNIFSFLSTATNSRADLSVHEEVLYVHYGDIHTKVENFLDPNKLQLPSIEMSKAKKHSFVANGDLLMADASEDYEGICKTVEVKNLGDKKAISGLHTFLLRDNNKVFVDGFRGYISSNKIVKNQFDKLATGLKVYGVSKTNLKLVSIPVPPREEQKAIAQILSEMDAEIEALETQRDKYKAVKQGMMQELLTGKTRLI